MEAKLIEKEEVLNFRFAKANVSPELTQAKLDRAVRLGNEFKGKSQILFMTEDGPKKIETTVWSVTENYLQIKSSVSIPISSLIDIQ